MTFFIISVISIGIVALLLALVLFEPGLPYRVNAPAAPLASDQYLCLLGSLADAQVHRGSRVEVHTNGIDFYEAMLAAIRSARKSVHIEAFIFHPSAIGDRFLTELCERAKAGVQIKVVIDGIGSFPTPNRYFKELRESGGRVEQYQPIRWWLLKHLNNRTHRELMVVDGEVGFIGGAGIAAHWSEGDPAQAGRPASPPWRDTVCQVTGSLVTGLQSTFAENWLESSGDILCGEACFPVCACGQESPTESVQPVPPGAGGPTRGIVVISTPSAARSTRARIVFQMLMASAKKSIQINSPYFVPDLSVMGELSRACERGVEVTVITPGKRSNHPMTQYSSQRRYGPLLQAGVRIYEYQTAMIHRKIMIVDGIWAVVGSTNFDNRSFGLNDEVNMAVVDLELAARLQSDFEQDRSESMEISYEKWTARPFKEQVLEVFCRLLDRQR